MGKWCSNSGRVVLKQRADGAWVPIFAQIKDIQRGDYDYLRILALSQLEKLNQQFYLEDREDVVQIKYEIQSPWIERFMQNFAFSFIRVGVDTISQTDGKMLSKKLIKCDGKSLILEMEGQV